MLTRFIKRQLVLFSILTVVALLVLGWYYLRLPSLAGIGQYQLKADLPASGGLYPTANVTYRGVTIGKVTDVEPTQGGAQATMSIASQYKIPLDASSLEGPDGADFVCQAPRTAMCGRVVRLYCSAGSFSCRAKRIPAHRA